MLGGGNDLDIFETRRFHAVGDELGGALDVGNVFRQSADAGDAQEGLQFVEETRFILLYEEVSGLGHTLL